MRVKNMVSVHGNTIPNQFVITGDGVTTFQSYQSTIAEVDFGKKEIRIGEDYNYSHTTGKYRNLFFEDYTPFRNLNSLNALNKAIKDGNTGKADGWTVRMI